MHMLHRDGLQRQRSATGKPERIGFLLVPGFALLSYASAVEPLRAANALSGSRLYEWVHIAPSDHASSSSGLGINADYVIGDEVELDILFVVAGGNPFEFDQSSTSPWLR